MPFLHNNSIKKHHNSYKTVYPTPKTGFVSVLTKRNELYEGNWVNDKREGFGSYVNKIHNRSIEYIPKYKGNWIANKQHGIGNGYMNDGYYVGEWRCNHRHGYGKMWYMDGSFYAGDWKSNQRDGDGLFVQYNGDRYEGEWKNDKKHGWGRFYHLNTGQMQEGIWSDDIAINSTIEDIPFRQSALYSTEYPIPTTQQKIVRFCLLHEIKIT